LIFFELPLTDENEKTYLGTNGEVEESK